MNYIDFKFSKSNKASFLVQEDSDRIQKGWNRNPKGWKKDMALKIIVRQRVESISLLEGEKWGLFADKNNVPIFSGDLFSSSWNHERDWLAFRQRGKIKRKDNCVI